MFSWRLAGVSSRKVPGVRRQLVPPACRVAGDWEGGPGKPTLAPVRQSNARFLPLFWLVGWLVDFFFKKTPHWNSPNLGETDSSFLNAQTCWYSRLLRH